MKLSVSSSFLWMIELLSVVTNEAMAEGFTSWPVLVRVTPGGVASLNWTLTSLGLNSGKIFKGSDPDADCIFYYNFINPSYGGCLPGYQARTQLHYGGLTVGFSLSDVTAADAGVYGCQHNFPTGSGGKQNNTNATIYVFGPPEKPTISQPAPVPEGGGLTITCQSTSTSEPSANREALTFTWLRDDQPVTTGSSPRHTVSGAQLTVEDVVREDRTDHLYSCVAQDGALPSADSDTVSLSVAYPPGGASSVPLDQPLIEEENLATDLSCTVSDPGYPAATFSWTRDGQPQSGGESGVYTIEADLTTVADHDGLWTCTPYNSQGDGGSASIDVIVNARAEVTEDLPADHTAVADDDASLSVTCTFVSKPAASMTWTYNGPDAVPNTVLVTEQPPVAVGKKWQTSGTVSWAAGQLAERYGAGGRYQCHVTVQLTEDVRDSADSSEMTLVVQYAPHDISLSHPASQTVVAGQDSVSQTCTAQCNPPCDYQWSDSQGEVSDNSLLTFDPAQKSHHGVYTCLAQNTLNQQPLGQLTKDFSLTVHYAPEAVGFGPTDVSPVEGSSLTLLCNISSRPDATVSVINADNNTVLATSVGQTAYYTYSSVQCLDTGNYRCTADNNIGSQLVQHTFIDIRCQVTPVSVTSEKGAALAVDVTFTQLLTANPFPSLKWTFTPLNDSVTSASLPDNVEAELLDSGHVQREVVLRVTGVRETGNYGWYQTQAGNQHGPPAHISFKLVPAAPPGQPSAPRLLRATAVSLEIEWTAGFDGGSQQTFTVIYVNTDTDQREQDTDGHSYISDNIVQDKLSGLEGSTSYRVWIRTENMFEGVNVAEGNSSELMTKATPRTTNGDDPSVTIHKEEGTAVVELNIENPDSVSHVTVQMCTDSEQTDCTEASKTINKRKRSTSDVILNLPSTETDAYNFYLTMFDGVDVVYEIQWTENAGSGSINVLMIAVAIAASVIVTGLIILFIVLWRKGILPKKDKRTRTNEQNGLVRRSDNELHALDNHGGEGLDAEEINPYGVSGAIGGADINPYGVTTATAKQNNNLASDKTGPVYAQVNKPKKDNPVSNREVPEGLYSQVNKPNKKVPAKPGTTPKPSAAAAAGTSDSEVAGPSHARGARPVSVFPPAKSSASGGEVPIYAQVNKKKDDKGKDKKGGLLGNIFKGKPKNKKGGPQEGQEYENVELKGERGPSTRAGGPAQRQYANVEATTGPEGAYSTVNVPRIGEEPDLSHVKPFQRVGLDGTIYAELDTMGNPIPGTGVVDPRVIHGVENRTEYASIDFSKLKFKKI